MSLFKKTLLAVVIIIIGIGVYYRDWIDYGLMQARGQMSILWNTQPITEILADSAVSDSVKKQLRLVEQIKRFAVDSLGLRPTKSYTTYYEQHNKPILWVMTAAKKYQLTPIEWAFPVIGTFSYKGFFDTTYANRDLAKLKAHGLDTQLNEVAAWSTLGFFKDPILSSMLTRSEGSLANLIMHEMTHGTIFVKDSLEINENLASFVGDYGAIRFLTAKYGVDSKELKKYHFQNQYREAYTQHIVKGTQALDSLYKNFGAVNYSVKDSLKISMIRHIIQQTDTLLAGKAAQYRKADAPLPNNAYFVGFLTYRSQQNTFKTEFKERFNNDFKKYFMYLKTKYKSSF
jgi:predicted aminopeptidase